MSNILRLPARRLAKTITGVLAVLLVTAGWARGTAFQWQPYPPGVGGPWGGAVKRVVAYDPGTGQNLWAATGGGVYRSMDGGQTWLARNTGLNTLDVSDISVGAQDPDFLIAATRIDGLYRTLNGGANWSRLTVRNGSAVVNFTGTAAIDPSNRNHLFVGSFDEGNTNYLLESIDGGLTWAMKKICTPTRLRFVYDGTKYVLILSTMEGYLWKYDGTAFSLLGGPFRDNSGTQAGIEDFALPGFTPLTIAVAAGRAGVRLTLDGGSNWSRSYTPTDLTATAISEDSANPSRLLMAFFDFETGLNGGLAETSNLLSTSPITVSSPEAGMYINCILSTQAGDLLCENIAGVFLRTVKSQPFGHSSYGMSAYPVAAFDFAPTGASSSSGGHGFAVSGGGVNPRNGNGGLNIWVPGSPGYWQRRPVGTIGVANGAHTGSTRMVRYETDSRIWTSVEGFTLYHSEDVGANWSITKNMSDSDVATNSVYDMEFGSDAGTMIFGGSGSVFYSLDGGNYWYRSSGLTDGDYLLGRESSILGMFYAVGKTSGVFRSSDFGVHWNRADSGFFSRKYINATAASRRVGGHLYAGTFYNGLYESRDYGGTWTVVSGSGGLPSSGSFGPVAFGDMDLDSLAAVNVFGDAIYITGDGGATWTRVTSGMELANLTVPDVYDLKFTPDQKALIAGVDGYGTYMLPLGEMPVMTAAGPFIAFVNRPYSLTLTGYDPEGANVAFGQSSIPQGSSFATDTFTWTPANADLGVHNCVFWISDGFFKRYYTLPVNVVPPNSPPVFDLIPDQTAVVGKKLTITLNATDADNDPVTYGAFGLPPGANIVNGNTFEWTPPAFSAGGNSVVFLATDGKEFSQLTVKITVDSPPVIQPVGDAQGNVSANPGVELDLPLAASDPDAGDTIFYYATDLSLQNPTAVNLGGNVFRFTSSTPGESRPFNFTVKDSKGVTGNTVSATIKVASQATDYAPVMNTIGNLLLGLGQTASITVTASSANGRTVVLSAPSAPQGSTFDPASGLFTWTPTSLVQPATVTFQAVDLDGNQNAVHTVTENVTITLNSPPHLNAMQPVIGTVGTTATAAATATDPDANETLTYYADSLPPWASINPATGVITWNVVNTPTRTVTSTIYVTDKASNRDSATETFTSNYNPALTDPGAKTVIEGSALLFTLQASDQDGDPVTFSATGMPSGATLNSQTGFFSFTPQSTAGSPFYVNFTATDSYGGQDSKTVAITVNAKPGSGGGGSGGGGGAPVPISSGGGGGGGGCFLDTLFR